MQTPYKSRVVMINLRKRAFDNIAHKRSRIKSTSPTQPRSKVSSGLGYSAQRFALYVLIK